MELLLILWALALATTIDYGRRVRLGSRSQRWISAPGRITRSRVVRVRAYRIGTRSLAQLEYRYTVAGQEFVGRDLGFRDPLDSLWEDGPRLAARFPKRRAIRVWYDPDNPARAVLHPGISPGTRHALYIAGTATGILTALIIGVLVRAV